jgi:ribosomal-protein-alanine N-acetyltransferase
MRIDEPPANVMHGIELRQLERSDVDGWLAYLTIPHVLEHTSWAVRCSDDLLPLFATYEDQSPTSPRRLAIIDADSGRLAGTIGFHTISDVNRSAEIAYDLAPAYWGRGIASAVCRAVTEWSFVHLGYVRVQAVVLETNLRSERVLAKSLFSYEGLLRSYRMVRGCPRDFKMYARIGLLP